MGKICDKPEHQDACLQIGSLVALAVSLFLFSGAWIKLFHLAMTPNGLAAVFFIFGAAVTIRYKNYQWTKNRRFSDGVGWTPDLYLYNSGDGTGPGLRAYMPDVKGASLLTPWSWLFGVKLRKIAIMLKDGRISFSWVPTRALANPAETLKCISVPEAYQITGVAAAYLQGRYHHIKRSVGKDARSEQDQEFMLLADVLFGKDSSVVFRTDIKDGGPDLSPLTGAILDLNTCLLQLGKDIRNVATSVNSTGSRITVQGKKITDTLQPIVSELIAAPGSVPDKPTPPPTPPRRARKNKQK